MQEKADHARIQPAEGSDQLDGLRPLLLGKLVGRVAIYLRARHGDTAMSPNDSLALALIALAYVGAELAVTSLSLVDRLGAIEVTDRASLEQAVLDRQQIGEATKRVQEFFRPLKQMADRLHKALCEQPADPGEDLILLLGSFILNHTGLVPTEDQVALKNG